MSAAAPTGTGCYEGATAVLATRHGKESVIAPPLLAPGVRLEVAAVDTDRLGTFSGEVPRPAPPVETAVMKARLGMGATGQRRGIASEGSFRPHPDAPWFVVDHEIVVLVDDVIGIVVVGRATAPATIAASFTATPGEDLARRLEQADLGGHAVIVRPNAGALDHVRKGLVDPRAVAAAVTSAAAASDDGIARVETDFRAHLCPSRRLVIAAAAADLATRLGAACPACGVPGWGAADVVVGVPCRWCGQEVAKVRALVEACVSCPSTVERPLEGVDAADPGECPRCNP